VQPLTDGQPDGSHIDISTEGRPHPDSAVVAVAMSGGVDSSVAAARCVAAGHRVVGIMLRLWAEEGAPGANRCCSLDAIDDARAVADVLGIPFSVIDAAAPFRAAVVDPFIQRSGAGETPNPCFTCNRLVRFGFLLERARTLGADYLATGHYARLRRHPDGTRALLRGADPAKDQSYMLHRLGQDQLARAMFPVGDLTKAEVRELARHHGLPVAERKDSVDLCWVAADGVPGFLARHLPAAAMGPGPIVDTAGTVLGRHRGLPAYTLGQRHGLGVATGKAVYVIAKDQAANTLVVGPADALMKRRVMAADAHWILGVPPAGPVHVEAQIRSRAPAAPAVATPLSDGAVAVNFEAPQRAPTPGQGIVLYQGEEVLGGATIVQGRRDDS